MNKWRSQASWTKNEVYVYTKLIVKRMKKNQKIKLEIYLELQTRKSIFSKRDTINWSYTL